MWYLALKIRNQKGEKKYIVVKLKVNYSHIMHKMYDDILAIWYIYNIIYIIVILYDYNSPFVYTYLFSFFLIFNFKCFKLLHIYTHTNP